MYVLILKKTKRAPKVEVGTGTTDASLDEWLQVCSFCTVIIHESLPTVSSFHSFLRFSISSLLVFEFSSAGR